MRGEQADPLVMYLVVRKSSTTPFVDLATAGVSAARECVMRFRDDPTWKEAFSLWFAASFRKVTLRATEHEWGELKKLDYVRKGDVLCLPPRRKSERETLIKRLQVYKEKADLPDFNGVNGLNKLFLVANADVEMSGGKLLAQLAHGVLMSESDFPIQVAQLPHAVWPLFVARHDVHIVRDYGLTEIARGTETVLVIVTSKS